MATKLANVSGPNGMGMHAAGIFSDMTVDGPEIGTLVLIVDRGKNLPNRRTMGKQSAYCAARLGKEAKKTETDKRGGQTPKWDQELRYTVHDSPDYYNLKISVFSEDKRTDLVGEAWVSLNDIIVPGGGKSDMWQGLHCKGKYAGEIRMEITYYDSRPKPERPRGESMAFEDETGSQPSVAASMGSKVKRRPLPNNPNGTAPEAILEPAIPVPGRAKHGPRDYRANSMPPEVSFQHHQLHSLYGNQPIQHSASHGNSPQAPAQESPRNRYQDEPQPVHPEQAQYEDPYAQPDLLPQLPPSNRHRSPTSSRNASGLPQPSPLPPRALAHMGLQHSHSAPAVPQYHQESVPQYPQEPIPQYHQEPETYHDHQQLRTDYPEPIPDLDFQHQQVLQRRNDVPPGWQEEYGDPYAQVESPMEEEEDLAPPPPPMHTVSAPAVPHFAPSPTARYGSAPPSARQNSVPSVSPLPGIERGYGSSHHTPTRGHTPRAGSVDHYASSPEQSPHSNMPSSLLPGGQPPPAYARAPVLRAPSSRHSVADPYMSTPPRPHPLSQEVPRARSPLPTTPQSYREGSYQQAYRPRAVSPQPPAPLSQPAIRSRSSYNLQHPVRGFESSDNSPLSTSRPDPRAAQAPSYTTRARMSVSPRPPPVEASSPGGVPYGPDSFDIHNPHARPTQLSTTPHSPYHVQPGAEIGRDETGGPIVGWHGQEIDPSDHLPVDSWAPEPEKKTPSNKIYGAGRDRDFGPRVPPKVPLQQEYAHDTVALSREISSIDIGSSRYGRPNSGSVPPPTGYVPVRSHRERNSFSFL